MSAARRAAFGAALTGSTGTTSSSNNPSTQSVNPPQVQQQSNQLPPPLPPPSSAINSNNEKGKQRESNNNNNTRNRNQRQPKPINKLPLVQNNKIIQNDSNDLMPKKPLEDEEEDDGTQCFICAEPVVYYAVGECDHRTCHTCAIRLRALYKKNACVFCKHECLRIVITSSPILPFTSFPPATTPFADTKLGISFETREQMDESLSLLRFNCPQATCNIISLGWSDLKRHAHSEHSSSLCDLCCSFKKIFSHEHTLFTGRDLVRHKIDEHMMCDFCNIGFYDADALYAHCRDRHEECFVCVKNGIRHQYHRNYDRLEAHYKAVHYLCPHPTCLEEKFVVFQSEIDLQAHAVSKHGASAGSQTQRRDARRIETNFTHDPDEFIGVNGGGSGGRGGRSGGGRGGRGGASISATAGNGRGSGERREADGSASASFINTGDGLSRNRVIPGLGNGPRIVNAQNGNGRDLPPHARASPTAVAPVTVESGERDGTLEKHAALMKRVGEVVSSDSKITSFKSAVRGYRGSETSAEDLVDTLWNVFDRNIDVAAGIIRSVADLFEDQEKSNSILSAWQDLRARQNQFPSLAPLAPALNGVPTTINAHAINNTNARSHRDPIVWARVANAAGSVAPPRPSKPTAPPREKFPALPMVPGMRGAKSGSSGQRNTPWMSAATAGFNAGGSNSMATSSRTTEADYERPPIQAASLPFARPTFITEVLPLPPTSSARQFPSLPSSSLEADRRARVRAALSKPDPSIVDREEFGTGSFWGAEGRGGGTSGTSTRSGSPENRNYSSNSGANAGGSGQMQKKKKKEKILLMSTGDGRGA